MFLLLWKKKETASLALSSLYVKISLLHAGCSFIFVSSQSANNFLQLLAIKPISVIPNTIK